MERGELTDIVIKSVEGAKRISDCKMLMIAEAGYNIAKRRSSEAQKSRNYGPLANFVEKSLKSLSESKKEPVAAYVGERFSGMAKYVAKADKYLNEINNFYNNAGEKNDLLEDIKAALLEVYKPDFATAYSSQIKTEKSLCKMRGICIAATALSAAALYALPCIPLAAVTAGLALGAGIVQKSIYDTRKIIKEAKAETAEEEKLYRKIENAGIEELGRVLADNKEAILSAMKKG